MNKLEVIVLPKNGKPLQQIAVKTIKEGIVLINKFMSEGCDGQELWLRSEKGFALGGCWKTNKLCGWLKPSMYGEVMDYLEEAESEAKYQLTRKLCFVHGRPEATILQEALKMRFMRAIFPEEFPLATS